MEKENNMCKNEVLQMVPKRYGYKEVYSRCGTTGMDGYRLMCDECYRELEKKYPQGWLETPGDLCEHGNYVGTPGGPDHICGKCEDGRD
jgi:hypothetical protein